MVHTCTSTCPSYCQATTSKSCITYWLEWRQLFCETRSYLCYCHFSSSDKFDSVQRWHDDTARRRSPASQRSLRRRCRCRRVRQATRRDLPSLRTESRFEPGDGSWAPAPSRRIAESDSDLLVYLSAHLWTDCRCQQVGLLQKTFVDCRHERDARCRSLTSLLQ